MKDLRFTPTVCGRLRSVCNWLKVFLAPPREWEYLKIDGDRLKAKDGEYILKLTEELWEIGYFDSVKLLAVDHPADVDIYSNEKVGPPSISQFKVHTVENPKTPIAAVDQMGRDVLPKIKARDEDFVQCFDRRFKQGLTEPHFLELDLGKLDEPQDITPVSHWLDSPH